MAEDLRLKKLAKLISKKNKILDLGCSAIPNIYLKNKEVIGVDLVDKELPKNYTDLKICNVLEMNKLFADNNIDGIVAGEILEHVEDPIGFLRECYNTLGEIGLIVLSTPNPNSFIERLLTLNLSRNYFYTKDHIMLYPQRWLIRMMEIAGFKDVKLYSGGMIFPFFSLIPFPRPWCYQTIATGIKKNK
jgi:2-polyprenyl-3-methyl-5-hydroxy-6-metoxy-1,4-benzoquinol methylase